MTKQAIGTGALNRVRKYFPNVERVNDATKPLAIEVTKGDEKSSKRRNHEECAMAVACKRKFGLDGVIISATTAYLIKGGTATRYSLPSSVQKEIVSFDRGATFEPGTYGLMKPDHKLGKEGGHTRSGDGNGPKRAYHMTTNIRPILGSGKER